MSMLIAFWLAGGWLLILPPLVVLGITAWVLIGNAIDRHHAKQDDDPIMWERHTTP